MKMPDPIIDPTTSDVAASGPMPRTTGRGPARDEVVHQPDHAPGFHVLAGPRGHGSHRDLHGVHVLSEGVGGGVLLHQGERAIAVHGSEG